MIKIVVAIIPCVSSSNTVDNIPSATSSPNQSQALIHQTSTSLPRPTLTPSHFLSSFHLYSSCPCRLLLLGAPGETGMTIVTTDIQGFLELQNKFLIVIETSAVEAELFCAAHPAHSSIKIHIPFNESETCSGEAEWQLATQFRNVYFIIWDEAGMWLLYCNNAVECKVRDIARCCRQFEAKVVLFYENLRQIIPVMEGWSRPKMVPACVKTYLCTSNFVLCTSRKICYLQLSKMIPTLAPSRSLFLSSLLALG